MSGQLNVQLLLFSSPRTPAVAKVCRIPASSKLTGDLQLYTDLVFDGYQSNGI